MKLHSKVFSVLVLTILLNASLCFAEESVEISAEKVASEKTTITPSFAGKKNGSLLNLNQKDQVTTEEQAGNSFSGLFTQVVKGLLYCVATILLFVGIYRRFFDKTSGIKEGNLITVLDRKLIAAKTALLVVEVSGKQFLLSQVQDDVQLLSELYDLKQLDQELAQEFAESEINQLNIKAANSK